MSPKKKGSSNKEASGAVAKQKTAKKTSKPRKNSDSCGAEAEPTAEAGKKNEEKTSDAKSGALPLKDVEGLSKDTRKALKERGITTLFEVQHRAFRPAFSGKDTVGRAKTGCGKTLAFVLPIIERIIADGLSDGKAGRRPLMLALAPTRELARQIYNELLTIASVHKLAAACLYGGAPFGPQVDELRGGLDAVVATPGRLLDHLRRETLSLETVRFVVLDEADEMLSMGFQEDVEDILSHVPKSAQKLLFSATMPKWVQNLIAKHLQKDHEVVDVVGEGAENQANANITHECISCAPFERGDTLADLCKVHAGAFGKTLVFTDTKKECDELAQNATLVSMGAGVLHGDIPQKVREVTMENFRSGKIKLLIATDVAARGLDVPNVDLVVQTHPPQDLDTYVHRSGRTARGGRSGTCVVFYSRNEEYLLRLLRNKKGIPIKRRGPPQPSEIVAQAARDAVRQVDHIHQDNVEAFTKVAETPLCVAASSSTIHYLASASFLLKVAEELLAERGSPVFLLAASLAAMTGYTARIKSRSLLTSYEGAVAILLESEREIEQTSKAWYLLRNMVPEEVAQACKGMMVVKGRRAAIFDCPQDDVQKVLKAECWRGIKFSVAMELPELEPHPGQSGEDDWKTHAESQKRRWEKIKNFRAKEAAEKQERREFNAERGVKRKFDDTEDAGEGKGKAKGKGKGKGGGRGFAAGKGTGRGFASG
eukprot:CAMPEP_0115172046 /NCGR_PEP_ID=MMETSP0270-20121206/2615_1 /TAXON_ID=71861 /ORGANISM="Scrippsiella trochoidea, Strain CCMP3099" /LENGTH=710 /DNA_ID=CAMNT_0002584829 /DNA_START=39 /DNA_END=2168 /DNA_ORIENTATION=+